MSSAAVTSHYATPQIAENLIGGLDKIGKTPETASCADLKQADEFHMGGPKTTATLLEDLQLAPSDRVLDVGCGIGGAVRHIAANFAVAQVCGIDLTPAYVETALLIGSWPGIKKELEEKDAAASEFLVGSGTDIPHPENSFDKVIMMHVGMNIADKSKLFSELARVLRPRGVCGILDVMQLAEELPAGGLAFPLPWASEAECSFVDRPDVYKGCAEKAGLVFVSEDDKSAVVQDMYASKQHEPATNPLALHILMGENIAVKVGNLMPMVKGGVIGPVQLLFRKPG